MLIVILIIILLVIIYGTIIINEVQKKGENKIVTINELPNKVDAIIVLGAGVSEEGNPSVILEDRLKTCISIYNSGIYGKVLLSGDHGKVDYNEVRAMKNYLLNNSQIKEEVIFMDHAGFSTYDSIYRASYIFKVKKAIICTNEYHLPRAIYLAEKHNIIVYGLSTDLRQYSYIDVYEAREKIAQFKDYIKINILKAKPKFLGEVIPINKLDGRVTDDEIKDNYR